MGAPVTCGMMTKPVLADFVMWGSTMTQGSTGAGHRNSSPMVILNGSAHDSCLPVTASEESHAGKFQERGSAVEGG